MINDCFSHVRGFNFQPPWGSNGRDVWLRFDGALYREILEKAMKAFPKMNTVRVWLSFDAWYDDAEAFLANVKAAGEILASLGLGMVPVYCNGWHSTPDFGGYTPEVINVLETLNFEPYRSYVRQTASVLEETGTVILQDISNEPLNNFVGNDAALKKLHSFLAAMGEELRAVSAKPITVGSQCLEVEICEFHNDVDYLQDIVDVFTLHPYAIWSGPLEAHKGYLESVLNLCKPYGKPVIVTECCWGAATDEERGAIVDTELKNYAEAGIGFIVHALSPSPVADLHKKPFTTSGMYMAFMNLDGTIRTAHECYNKY